MFTSTASSNSVLSKPHDDYPQSLNHPADLDEMYAALLFSQANLDVLDTDDEFVLDDNGGTTLFQDAKEQTALDFTLEDILAVLSKVLMH